MAQSERQSETQVEIQINSVNYICDWKYNIANNDINCCFCNKNDIDEYHPRSQRKCTLKVYGLVSSKCGHVAHLSCYKRNQQRRQNQNQDKIYCSMCPDDTEFVFDLNLETPHTKKIYKI